MLSFFSEEVFLYNCEDPTPVANARMELSDTRTFGHVTYICHTGHVFEGGGLVRTLVCMPNGRWSAQIKQGCIGR